MREILFRAKRMDNGEWLCGSYCLFYCPNCGAKMDEEETND